MLYQRLYYIIVIVEFSWPMMYAMFLLCTPLFYESISSRLQSTLGLLIEIFSIIWVLFGGLEVF